MLNLDCVFQTFSHLETERLVSRRMHLSDAESLLSRAGVVSPGEGHLVSPG